jgi:hypothetical protein
MRDMNDVRAAKEALTKVVEAGLEEPTWLRPWTHVRLGEVALAEKRKDDAIAELQRALGFPEDGTGFTDYARRQLERLERTGAPAR